MREIRTILVPVDFSAQSRPALDHALNLAHHFEATVRLLHAVDIQPLAFAAFEGGVTAAAAPPFEELKQAAEQDFHNLLAEVTAKVPVETSVVQEHAAQAILEAAKTGGAGMVVMPTHGRGRFRRLVLGSVTTRVLNEVACPVFTGAHLEEVPPMDPKPYRRVLCAVDLEEASGDVLRWAAEFASAFEAKLFAVHAAPQVAIPVLGISPPEDLNEKIRKGSQERLEDLVAETGAEAELAVRTGSPARVIRDVAREQDIDLVIIGRNSSEDPHERLGAHVYGILRACPCPMISV